MLPASGEEKGNSSALALPEQKLAFFHLCSTASFYFLIQLHMALPTHPLSTQTEETGLYGTGQKPALSRSNSADWAFETTLLCVQLKYVNGSRAWCAYLGA